LLLRGLLPHHAVSVKYLAAMTPKKTKHKFGTSASLSEMDRVLNCSTSARAPKKTIAAVAIATATAITQSLTHKKGTGNVGIAANGPTGCTA